MDIQHILERLYTNVDNLLVENVIASDDDCDCIDIATCIPKREFKTLVIIMHRMNIPYDVYHIIRYYMARSLITINTNIDFRYEKLRIAISPSCKFSGSDTESIVNCKESRYICTNIDDVNSRDIVRDKYIRRQVMICFCKCDP